jgi:pyridinium-3,5-bisthiocarboxylic acid mononucleotide nickel chelatase
MTVLYFDCVSGAAGDMLLAALLDVGADENAVRGSLEALGIPGWRMDVEQVTEQGLRARRVTVTVEEQIVSRPYRDIRALLERAELPDNIRERALSTFALLGAAEARVHDVALDEVHFHEVGGTDALIDIVGCAAALEDLRPSRIVSSGLVTGRGLVPSAHGQLPVPAPAVLEILRGVPLTERGERELVTPTGAAILKANADVFGAMPGMRVDGVGYGAGHHELQWPNVVRVLVGSELTPTHDQGSWLIETNIDDMTPELIPYCIESLIQAGASDAWTSSIVMKKGRPALTLSTLVREENKEQVLDVIYKETTTLGVRMLRVEKDELEREWINVKVGAQDVRVKLGVRNKKVVSVAPEYEDALVAGRAEGIPLREVYEKAVSAAATKLGKRY